MLDPLGSLLVVCLDNLGDLVLASALFPPLRERFPKARLCLWCKAYTAPIARLIPGINRIFAADPFWDAAPGRGRGSLKDFLRTLLEARGEHPQAALITSANWRAAAAAWGAAIPLRIGWGHGLCRLCLNNCLAPADSAKPASAELGRLLSPLGIRSQDWTCRLDPAPLGSRLGLWAGRLPKTKTAALHPFAGDARRCVPLAEWRRLALELSKRGFSVLWIGAPSELETLRKNGSPSPNERTLDAWGPASLEDLAAAAAASSLFIGHDSGPLHVASALGVPCLGIFTPGEPLRTFPQGTGRWRVLTRPAPDQTTAEEILRAAEALL